MSQLHLPNNNHRLVCLIGSSGTGKTTVIHNCLEHLGEDRSGYLESFCTRQPRPSDQPGEFIYLTWNQIEATPKTEIAWVVNAHGNFYGNNKQQLIDSFTRYYFSFVALTPDTIPKLAALLPKERYELIYLLAPQEIILQKRLLEGRQESPAVVERRIADCRDWDHQVMSLISEGHMIHPISNRTPEATFQKVMDTIKPP